MTEAPAETPTSEPTDDTERRVIREPVQEIGGRRDGPEPTRYGDWEKQGRCIDF